MSTKEGTAIGKKIDEIKVNEHIRAREVRLISAGGEQLGILPLDEALKTAKNVDLDLVEVAPNSDPPVCRIMDYGKRVGPCKSKRSNSGLIPRNMIWALS